MRRDEERIPVAREFMYDPFMEYAKEQVMWIVKEVMVEEMKERLKRKYQALGEDDFLEEFAAIFHTGEEEGGGE